MIYMPHIHTVAELGILSSLDKIFITKRYFPPVNNFTFPANNFTFHADISFLRKNPMVLPHLGT